MNIAVKIIFAACQPYRVLTYIPTHIRVVIPEPIVVQSRLLVLVLPQLPKWNELSVALEVEQVAVDVIVGLPDERSVFVVGLHGATDVVAHDTVTLAVYQLGGWNIAVCVVNPGDEVVHWFGPVERHIAVFGNYLLRPFRFVVLPFVKDNVAIPKVAVHAAVESLFNPSAQCVIFECDGLAVWPSYAAQHAVRQPCVGVVARVARR